MVLRTIEVEEQAVNRIPVFTGESTSDGGGAISVGFIFDANIVKAVGGQTYSHVKPLGSQPLGESKRMVE